MRIPPAKVMSLLAMSMLGLAGAASSRAQAPAQQTFAGDPFFPLPTPQAEAQRKAEPPRPLPPPPAEPDARDLERFQEPRLSKAVAAKDLADGPTQIRFMWIRSFDPPLCVRAFMTAEGPRLRVVRLSNTARLAKTLPLAEADWAALLALTQDAKAVQPYAGLTNEERLSLSGLDGASWMLEVRAGDTYHFSDVWSPSAFVKEPGADDTEEWKRLKRPDFKPFIALCTKLIEHAGLQAEERY